MSIVQTLLSSDHIGSIGYQIYLADNRPAILPAVVISDASGNSMDGATYIKDKTSGALQRMFVDPANEAILEMTSLRSYFSDDFGGAALDATKWTVYDGGLGAVTIQPGNVAQTAIGTGTTGITHSITASTLSVVMGTTNGAEKWFLSNQMFCCSEDVLIIVSKSQALAANSIQFGLIEVDPVTGYPYQNGTVSTEFTNKAMIELGQTTNSQFAGLRTIGDNSPAEYAPAASSYAPAAMSTAFEIIMQIRAEDVHAHSGVVDSSGARLPPLRASSQMPNDTKVYKLLLRFKNVSVPGSSTTITISRVLVENHQAIGVSILEAKGTTAGSQGLAVNLGGIRAALGLRSLNAGTTMGLPSTDGSQSGLITVSYCSNGITLDVVTKPNAAGRLLSSAATTNATNVKASAGEAFKITGNNTVASKRYLKLYNKASAPTVGTDTPILTFVLQPSLPFAIDLGATGQYFSLGISYAITGAAADADTTAIGAGDIECMNITFA